MSLIQKMQLMFRVLQTKSRIPGRDVFKNGILHELLQSDLICIPTAKAYLNPWNILESFLMKLWWNALRSKAICMQCKQAYRYGSCSHVKSCFCCFTENVHVSCASYATVLVKELGHPICEYFDDQGPFWTHNKMLTLQWWQQNVCTRWRNVWQAVQNKTSYRTFTIKISWHSHGKRYILPGTVQTNRSHAGCFQKQMWKTNGMVNMMRKCIVGSTTLTFML